VEGKRGKEVGRRERRERAGHHWTTMGERGEEKGGRDRWKGEGETGGGAILITYSPVSALYCVQCFDHYKEFDFSPLHDCVLTSFVWPRLILLPQENLQSPTPLLKLLATWSAHTR
jgi:hypothetical protein